MPKQPKPLRRVGVVAAELGLKRELFISAARRGEIPFEIVALGPRGLLHARERVRPPIDPAAVFAARARS